MPSDIQCHAERGANDEAMKQWAMVVVDEGEWGGMIAAELEEVGVEAFVTHTDPREVIESLVNDDLSLPSLLIWRSARPTEQDLDLLHELRRLGVGVILTADHRTMRSLRRADRGGLMSRAWRYGSAAVVSRHDRCGLARVARELLRSADQRRNADPPRSASQPRSADRRSADQRAAAVSPRASHLPAA
jgi:hypothetical protein